MGITIFGVRHHGPGCARSLRAALEQLQPDMVLVEGPPDAQNVLHLLTHKDMRPPVALLIYAPDNPKRAVYYPFTTFSPEWQALSYALSHGIPARFMDLPQAFQLGNKAEAETPKVKTTVHLGEAVKIVDGAFAEFTGNISEINAEKNKVTVLVSIFGRETPISLDFLQVERIV